MKSTFSLNGGSLRAGSEAAYGRLLIAQADWLASHNVPLRAMTLGNEPFHSSTTYPTMTMTTGQMVTLGNQVSPSLSQKGVELWAVDHNWEHRSSYDTVLAGASGRFAASAFHCYGGSVSQMLGVAAPPIMTECTGTNDTFAGTFRWDTANLIAGAIEAGSTGLMMWNLALDQNHGPHTGGCGTCRGVVDVHSSTGAITPTPEFYVLAHVSRAADPDSKVIGTSRVSGIPYVAFRNPDGQIGIVGHNDTGSSQALQVQVGDSATETATYRVAAGALFTLRGRSTISPGTTSISTQTAKVDVPLNAATSGWTPSSVDVAFQWLADGSPIAGANADRFVPTERELGKRISVRATASKVGFAPSSVQSSATLPVAAGDQTPPATPTGLRNATTQWGWAQITVSWSKSESAPGYKLSIGRSGATARTVRVVGDVNSATFAVLSPATTYSFDIQALGSSGVQSRVSPRIAVKTRAAPTDRPSNIRGTAKSSSTLTLTWLKNTSVSRYAVSIGPAGGTHVTKLIGTTLPYKFTGLKPNTVYTVAVRGVESDGSKTPASETYSNRTGA